MLELLDRSVNYALFAKFRRSKTEVIDLSYHEVGCSRYPNGGLDPSQIRKLIVVGADVVAGVIKIGTAIGAIAILGIGAYQISDALKQSDLPLVLDIGRRAITGFGINAVPAVALHLLQRKLDSGPTYNPGDLVPTRGPGYLKIIK